MRTTDAEDALQHRNATHTGAARFWARNSDAHKRTATQMHIRAHCGLKLIQQEAKSKQRQSRESDGLVSGNHTSITELGSID